ETRDLDHDVRLDVPVQCAVDGPHPSFTELRRDQVASIRQGGSVSVVGSDRHGTVLQSHSEPRVSPNGPVTPDLSPSRFRESPLGQAGLGYAKPREPRRHDPRRIDSNDPHRVMKPTPSCRRVLSASDHRCPHRHDTVMLMAVASWKMTRATQPRTGNCNNL